MLGYSNPLKAIRYHVDKDDKGVNASFAPREAEQLIRRHERELAECSGVVKAAPAPWLLQYISLRIAHRACRAVHGDYSHALQNAL